MKSMTIVFLSLLLGSASFATPVPAYKETQILDCGVLRDQHGTASKSAPYVAIVSRESNGKVQTLVQEVALRGRGYELLGQKSVNHGANVMESKNYILLTILNPKKIVIKNKTNPNFTAVCKETYRL